MNTAQAIAALAWICWFAGYGYAAPALDSIARLVGQGVDALVDRLMTDTARPPMIILQADRGHRRFPDIGNPPPLREADPVQAAERTDIFAADHIPRLTGSRELYDSLTPVNVFPALLLGHVFGAAIPLLEDRTYYSSHDEPYRFTRLP